MFDKFSRSWDLVKASASVLRSDKELMLFPILSSLATLLVLATFALPVFMLKLFDGGFNVVAAVVASPSTSASTRSSSSSTARWSARRRSASKAATRPSPTACASHGRACRRSLATRPSPRPSA